MVRYLWCCHARFLFFFCILAGVAERLQWCYRAMHPFHNLSDFSGVSKGPESDVLLFVKQADSRGVCRDRQQI